MITDSGLGVQWSGDVNLAPYLHFLVTDFFSAQLNDARNNAATLLSLMPSDSQSISGKFVIEPVKFGRNMDAFNSVREGGKFPDPKFTKSRIYAYRSRHQFTRFKMDGFLLRSANSDMTRYIDPLVDVLADFHDDWVIDTNRKMHSDGSGRIAEIASGTASATQTVRLNQDIETLGGLGATAPDMPATLFFTPDTRYMIVDPTGATVRGIVNLDSIDSDTQVTFDASVTTTTGDWIVKCSNDDSTAASQVLSSAFRTEPMGIGGIFSASGVLDGHGPATEVATAGAQQAYTWSGTDDYATTNAYYFQGIPANVAATGWTSELTFNQAVVFHNSGVPRPVTEELIQIACSDTEERNNAMVEMFLSGYRMRDSYAVSLLGEKRYVNTVELKGGWSPAIVGPMGIPWAVDRWCYRNRLYGLALRTGGFKQHVKAQLQWATYQGSPVWTYLEDDDFYQARMVESYNNGVGVRDRAGFVLGDLQEIAGP